MKKLIVIESTDIKREEDKVSHKQLDFIKGLMKSPKMEIIYLDNLAQYVDNRFSKTAASKLITALLNHDEFEIRQLKK